MFLCKLRLLTGSGPVFSWPSSWRSSAIEAQATHDAAQARLRAAEAGRRQADLGRGFATMTALLASVVAQRLAEVGEMAQPGRPLLALYAPRRLPEPRRGAGAHGGCVTRGAAASGVPPRGAMRLKV